MNHQGTKHQSVSLRFFGNVNADECLIALAVLDFIELSSEES